MSEEDQSHAAAERRDGAGMARSWAGPASTRRQGSALDQRGRDGAGPAILGSGEDWDDAGEDRVVLEEARARSARCAAAKPYLRLGVATCGRTGSESRGREEKGKERNVFFITDGSAGNFVESDPPQPVKAASP